MAETEIDKDRDVDREGTKIQRQRQEGRGPIHRVSSDVKPLLNSIRLF